MTDLPSSTKYQLHNPITGMQKKKSKRVRHAYDLYRKDEEILFLEKMRKTIWVQIPRGNQIQEDIRYFQQEQK